ncbi:MAG: 16S rRNA (adenine(1518)-N(6)/adenine(1519)-N(6))-dimethyltransferase RsmA, partial [Candidatus Uhrbacteria bacterium]|nr:16S rRNA (adenine(1518)-N(6)/adenine(1519)-N(6))-dimethyltransferase RsmA [Candidatus Uhrbacteria bacterium]
MNPSEIRTVLKEIGGGANKRLGQHFLIDPHALATIVEEAEVEKGDRVLEIGPGLGVLTSALIDAGAQVTAVERDRRFVEWLEKNVGARRAVPLQIIHGDASRLDWENQFKNKPWKFVSNLPYSITSLALRKALYATHPPSNLVVLVQREVAERAVAREKGNGKKAKWSLLSLMVAFAAHEARIVKRVSAGSFFPPPRVESAILRIIPMTQEERKAVWGRDPEEIMAIAKRGFAHPRKLLASNLGFSATNLPAYWPTSLSP